MARRGAFNITATNPALSPQVSSWGTLLHSPIDAENPLGEPTGGRKMKSKVAGRSVSRRDCLRLGATGLLAGLPNWAAWGQHVDQEQPTSVPESREPKSVAAIITVYFHNSHADVLLTKILEGWRHDGGPGPALKLAAVYIDQPEGSQFGIEILRKHGIRICDTIEQAITLGGPAVAVDGVLSIGEHGNYPVNAQGQQLYPRKRFFAEISDTFAKYGRVVPVFNDKHISTVWDDALWMYKRAKAMNIPFMSGSSLPVAFRSRPMEVPLGSEIEAAVGVGYSGLDIYGFHALECYQTIVERRRNAEQGVRWVRCLEGDAVWQAVADGWVDADAMDAVYQCLPKSASDIREDKQAVLFQFEYQDGFRGSQFMLSTAQLTGVAVKMKGGDLQATGFEERVEPRYPHFSFLLKAIEEMMHSGQPTYPVERTLLTGGILDRALQSKFEQGRQLTTPELAIAYAPVDYPHAPQPLSLGIQ